MDGGANKESDLLPGSFWHMKSGLVVEVAGVYKHTVHYLGPLTHNRYIADKASFLLGHCVTRADQPIDLRRHMDNYKEPHNVLGMPEEDKLLDVVDGLVEIPEPPAKPKTVFMDIKPVIEVYLQSTDDRLEEICRQIIQARGSIYTEVSVELAKEYDVLSEKYTVEQLVTRLIQATRSTSQEETELVAETAEILRDLRRICHYDDTEVARAIVQNR